MAEEYGVIAGVQDDAEPEVPFVRFLGTSRRNTVENGGKIDLAVAFDVNVPHTLEITIPHGWSYGPGASKSNDKFPNCPLDFTDGENVPGMPILKEKLPTSDFLAAESVEACGIDKEVKTKLVINFKNAGIKLATEKKSYILVQVAYPGLLPQQLDTAHESSETEDQTEHAHEDGHDDADDVAEGPVFHAKFSTASSASSKVSELSQAVWQILSDWNCQYSDWEGWGLCSTRCGGGKKWLIRYRLLYATHGGKNECPKNEKKIVSCNTHKCMNNCKEVAIEKRSPFCTVRCGGGVALQQSGLSGSSCPSTGDSDIVSELCGDERCRSTCVLSSEWMPLTGCSEICGQGVMLLQREVVSKEPDDDMCTAEIRQEPCFRHHCGDFAVVPATEQDVFRCEAHSYAPVNVRMRIFAKHVFNDVIIKVVPPIGYKIQQNACDKIKEWEHTLPSGFTCELSHEDSKSPQPQAITIKSAASRTFEFQVTLFLPACSDLEEHKGLDRWQAHISSQGSPGDMVMTWVTDIIEDASGTKYAQSKSIFKQDWVDCEGPIKMWNSGGHGLCFGFEESEERADSDTKKVVLEECLEHERWVIDPSGVGHIGAVEDKFQFGNICATHGAVIGSPIVACGGECGRENCAWIIGTRKKTRLRLRHNMDFCIGTSDSEPQIGSSLVLHKCPLDDRQKLEDSPGLSWEVPCPKEKAPDTETWTGFSTTEETPMRTQAYYCMDTKQCPDKHVCSEFFICEEEDEADSN